MLNVGYAIFFSQLEIVKFYLLDYGVYALFEVPDFLGSGWDFYDKIFVFLDVVVNQIVEVYVSEVVWGIRSIDLTQDTTHHVGLFQQSFFSKWINNPKSLLNFRYKFITCLTYHQRIRIFGIIKKLAKPHKLFLINLINLHSNFLKFELLNRQFIPILTINHIMINILPHFKKWLKSSHQPIQPRKNR